MLPVWTIGKSIKYRTVFIIYYSGGVFSNSDVSVVPLVRKADIMIMKNKTEYDELESLR